MGIFPARILADKRLVAAWAILVGITLISWFVATRHGPGPLAPDPLVGMIAIVITLAKVRLISREFMELRHAPAKLRAVIDLWLVAFGLAMVAAYFM
jgi:Prokaryotic Cytochrome C oxidase subunit IV